MNLNYSTLKNTLTLFALLTVAFVSAQFHPGKVYFKDNTSKEGLILRRTFGGIKFKTDEDSQEAKYSSDDIDGYDINEHSFRYVKLGYIEEPILMTQVLDGDITLYVDQVGNPSLPLNNGFTGTGMGFGGGTSSIYYIKVKNEVLRLGTRLKKDKVKIFNDCPSLIQKIENKELKRRNIYKIVEYYNQNCGESN